MVALDELGTPPCEAISVDNLPALRLLLSAAHDKRLPSDLESNTCGRKRNRSGLPIDLTLSDDAVRSSSSERARGPALRFILRALFDSEVHGFGEFMR